MHRLSVGLALFTVAAVSMSCGLIPPEKEFFQIWEPDAALVESDPGRYSVGGDGGHPRVRLGGLANLCAAHER